MNSCQPMMEIDPLAAPGGIERIGFLSSKATSGSTCILGETKRISSSPYRFILLLTIGYKSFLWEHTKMLYISMYLSHISLSLCLALSLSLFRFLAFWMQTFWHHNLKDFQLSTLKSAIAFLFPRCHCTIITRLVNYTTLTRLEAPTHHHQWPDQKRILGLMGEYEGGYRIWCYWSYSLNSIIHVYIYKYTIIPYYPTE